MSQPIQERPRQPFTAHHFRPFFKGQIGGDDQAGAFIRPADHVEEQFRPGLGERDIAELVQNQNVEPFELFVQPLQGARLALFEQLGHQSVILPEGQSRRANVAGEVKWQFDATTVLVGKARMSLPVLAIFEPTKRAEVLCS